MDDSGQPGDAPGGGGNPPSSRDGDAWADRDRDSGTPSAWHRSRYANLLTPIVPASRQPRQQVNGSAEVHSTSAPPYPYEGDLEDAAQSSIPTQTNGDGHPPAPPWPRTAPVSPGGAPPPAVGGDPDWRGWAPPPGEALPEPPSPWAPGWAPAPTDGGTPDRGPTAPPAPPAVLPGPFASAFPPAPPPVRFRPRQDEPARGSGDGQPPAPAAPPSGDPAARHPADTDATGGFPPIGAVAAGASTEGAPPGTPTEADPYPAGFRPGAGSTVRRPDWAPEWPWSPAPPAPTSPAGQIPVPAPRPTQPQQPTAAPTSPGAAGPMTDDGTLPSRRGFAQPAEPPHRNTLPGYIRGGAAPSDDEARFITGSHPTVAPNAGSAPFQPEQTPDSEPTGDARAASGGFPVESSGRVRVERTASGSFPVVDRRSAGLSRSFPASEPADPPVTPSQLSRAFPGGAGAPAAPQTTPSTGAFPGGGERVPPIDPPTAAGADRPTDLSGRRSARPPAPVSPAADAGPRDDAPVRPPLRLASRNGDPIATDAGPAAERSPTDRYAGDGGQRGFPGAPTSGAPAGEHRTGFSAGDGARRAFGGSANDLGAGPAGDPAGGRSTGDPAGNGPAGDPTGGGFVRGYAGSGFAGDQGGGIAGDPGGGFVGDSGGGFGSDSGAGIAGDSSSGFADDSGGGLAGDSGGGFGRDSGGGFGGDPGGGFGGTRAGGAFAAERANGGFGGEATNGGPGGTTNGGFGDEPAIPLQQRPIDRAPTEIRSVVDDMIDELSGLPQRVPAEPDVPTAPEPPSDVPADPPQLARIATHLRRPDLPEERERPDGFDVDAILDAVRGVPGVKDASLRTTPAGAHSLRLDLADGADAADVSRHVARLLQERMGLAAAPQNLPGMSPHEPPASPLGGNTPPTGFTRSGGYVPPPPAEPGPARPAPRAAESSRPAPRVAEPIRPAPRPTDATRPAANPAEPVRSAPYATDATRSAANPAEPVRPAPYATEATRQAARPAEPIGPGARPAEPIRPGARPAEPIKPAAHPAEPIRPAAHPAEPIRPAAHPAEPIRPAARPAEATKPAPRPADGRTPQTPAPPGLQTPPPPGLQTPTPPGSQAPTPPAAQTPAPPGFEPPADQAQRPAGSHRGRAPVGAQPGVDTRDLAARAAAAAAPVSAAPVSAAPVSGAPKSAEPTTHRHATDGAERGHLYGGTRESDPRTGSDQPASGSFPELGSAAGIIGNVGGHPVMAAATAYSGGQITTTESAPSRPLNPGAKPGPRVVIDHVQVSTFGLDATVETRLAAGKQVANGLATGPAVDAYVLRLCAVSAATAIDELLRTASRADDRGRCFVEHAAVVPFGNCEVAVVVVLLVCGGWVEQLAGSALVSGDPRQAVVRATLAAVNRRLEALLSD